MRDVVFELPIEIYRYEANSIQGGASSFMAFIWLWHPRRNWSAARCGRELARRAGERTMMKSMRREPAESADRGRISDSPRETPVISAGPPSEDRNAPKHEIRADQTRSFCARRNHRDFLAISWNIWAICLRDEEPRGVSHWPNRPFLFSLLLLLLFFLPLHRPTTGIPADRTIVRRSLYRATTAKIANISGRRVRAPDTHTECRTSIE